VNVLQNIFTVKKDIFFTVAGPGQFHILSHCKASDYGLLSSFGDVEF